MILIADSGSTKTDWCAVEKGEVVAKVATRGLNPFFMTSHDISKEISLHLVDMLPTTDLDGIYFYGAGCVPDKYATISDALEQHFSGPITVASDMLGAAHALCGDNPGIACILGTGANSCYYDGKKITSNVSPLGYILGDEGSGAVLGKIFVGNVLKNQMPRGLKEKFLKAHNLTPAEIIDKVYREPLPNRFLASFAPFINQHIEIPEVKQMVIDAFRSFITRNVKQYPEHTETSVHFVGSIAKHFKEVLQEACDLEGIQLGNVLRGPIEGLIKYHSK